MARKNETPQKAAMREKMLNYLKDNDISIKSGTDVNSVMKDMISVILEGALDEELMKNSVISNMITKTKKHLTVETDIPTKQCIPVMEIWKTLFHVTEMVSTNHSSLRNIRIRLHRIWRKNVYSDHLEHTARCFSACFPVLQCMPLVV